MSNYKLYTRFSRRDEEKYLYILTATGFPADSRHSSNVTRV